MTCAICGRLHNPMEPTFTRYALGEMDGVLCEKCAAPVRNAITRAMRDMQREHNARVRLARRELAPRGLRKAGGL
jgi:hypothetical protein